MYIISYGDPSIFHGYSNNEILMAGRRKCSDCDDCSDYAICVCEEDDEEGDCWPVFCGYD